MTASRHAAIGCALVTALVACKGDRAAKTRAAPAPPAVSMAEATAVAREVALAAKPCDPAKLAPLFDDEAVARRSADASPGPSLAASFCGSLAEGTEVGVVIVRDTGGVARATLRALDADGHLDYHELDIAGAPARVVGVTPSIAAQELLAVAPQLARKDLATQLAAIERLDQRVGGDPYLADMRAEAYVHDPTPEHLTEAERWARVAIAGLPDREHVWWTLLVVQTRRRDHAGVVATLGELRRRFAVEIDRDKMAGMTIFRDFMASPEFTAWAAQEPVAPPPDAAP